MGASGRPNGAVAEGEAMDFETQYRELCVALSKQGQVTNLTKEFNSMTSDESRVRFLLTLDCVRAPSRERASRLKCPAESGRLRSAGNAAYGRRGQERAALQLYTQAVLAAPEGDEALPLALANRSAVLLSLGHLGPCLADMSRALRHGYPQRLHSKLEQRLEKLRELALREPSAELPETPTLSPDLTDEQEETLVSGEVLMVEQPYCAVVLPEESEQHCHHCCRWSPAPIGCLHCVEVRFCSRRCRAAAWEQYHSVECPIYGHLVALDAGQMALLAVRSVVVAGWQRLVASQAQSRAPLPPEYRSDDYRRVRDLEGNVSARPAADLFKRALMAVLLGRLLTGSSLVPAEMSTNAGTSTTSNGTMNGDSNGTSIITSNDISTISGAAKQALVTVSAELLRHLQTYPCNAHEVSEQVLPGGGLAGATTRQTGAAVLPAHSLTNHSCDPNVFRGYHGTTAVLRALRPLASGEELCDNYGYHYALMPREERRRGLARQYYFVCQCTACVADLPTYPDIPSGPPRPVCRTCGGEVATCGHVADVAAYTADVARAAGQLEEAVAEVLHGEASAEVRGRVGRLVTLLDKRVALPWRGLNDAQEVFKMCYLVDGDVSPGAEGTDC
ncbi:SET and MYND domain-containing protein 4-like [Amphibalanus amphitrite]|uniref:SET and MYND domain-containing protein 4-like n=1 Tax=Amphibalanus amphitrite TaxID=1232801 RepID=UPI001C916356|nr:SET and MYND domain-containing protein 4-like [Amphibalanus amphitrite]